MDVKICSKHTAVNGLFTATTFRNFFALLESTDLRRLELRQLATLPTFSNGYQLPSLRILRLSGTVDLRAPVRQLIILASENAADTKSSPSRTNP